MSLLDRRMFLRVLAATGATPALLTAQDRSGRQRTDAVVWKRTPCRLCDVGCGMLVGIQDGRAVAIKGDVDAPANRGLACVKGYYAVQALYGSDRIRYAMIRRNGTLVRVPLQEAYDVIAARLRATVRQHGRDSVALYGSGQWSLTDAYVAGKLWKGALGSNHIDTSARLYSSSARAGASSSVGVDGPLGSFADIEQADVVVLWNHNIAETDPVLFSRILERRRTNRLRVIELAARTTRTSYGIDRSIRYAPHAELAVIHAICHEIVARRRVNREFVERHVAFRKGSTAVDYGLEGEPIKPEVAAAASWKEYVNFLGAEGEERVRAA